MLAVQDYIHKHGLQKLQDEYKIKVTNHEFFHLVVLNYDQIESPRNSLICRECRGLVLERDSWNVVAKAFDRFFNLGEMLELTKKFDWNDFTATAKEDGTLILLYNYKGRWIAGTRQTFGGSHIRGYDITFDDLFFCEMARLNSCWPDELPTNNTYAFELCSPYNKVVRSYYDPKVFLISAFNNGIEIIDNDFGLPTVNKIEIKSRDHLYEIISKKEKEDPTFEGFVLRDKNGLRIKAKTSTYLALHHICNNGIISQKRAAEIVMSGEIDEVVVYFPEYKNILYDTKDKIDIAHDELLQIFYEAREIEEQKKFAIYITKKHQTPFSGLLFDLKNRNAMKDEDFEQNWISSKDKIIKILFK